MTAENTERCVDPADLLALISTRRVVRDFTSQPVEERHLWMILEAGRWATCASNNRVHRLLVVRDRQQIKLVTDMSPGIFSHPAVMVVICTDLRAVATAQLQLAADRTVFIDVGTLMMNMMVEAHALGLGTCPATSFSQAGVEVVLGLPPHARPEAILQIGHIPGGRQRVARRQTRPSRLLAELVSWERYGQASPLPWRGGEGEGPVALAAPEHLVGWSTAAHAQSRNNCEGTPSHREEPEYPSISVS